MADGAVRLENDPSGQFIDNSIVVYAGSFGAGNYLRQRINIADPSDAAAIAAVLNTTPGASEYGQVVRIAGGLTISGTVSVSATDLDIRNLEFATDKVDISGSTVLESIGTFGYRAAILTSGNLAVTGRVLSYRVFASGADGEFNINGGDTIKVRQDTGFDWSPRTPLTSPTFNWISGVLDLFVELAT